MFQGILFVLHTSIAREHLPHELGFGLGAQRRVVERAFAQPHWFRRLRIRWEIHEGFLTLACALICWRRLRVLK